MGIHRIRLTLCNNLTLSDIIGSRSKYFLKKKKKSSHSKKNPKGKNAAKMSFKYYE